MMKKLLVLMLVLGVSSLASAGLTLKIHDNMDGSFDIMSTAFAGGDDVYFAAVSADIETTGGAIDGGPVASFVMDKAVTDGFMPVPADGVWGYFGDPFGAPAAGGNWARGIQARIGAVVDLYIVAADWSSAELVDTVTLVPEPMSMLLLGLGGLFLRRRK
jgi:hypothetical protein